MTRKDYVALADILKEVGPEFVQGPVLLGILRFCRQQNARFDEDKFLGYLRGDNGPHGGKS